MKINSTYIFKVNLKGLIALCLAVFISLLFPETSQAYLSAWLKFDESMGHALLIVAMVSYLLLKPNEPINRKITTKKNLLWLIPIILTVLVHQISIFLGILIFQQFSLYVLWLLAINFVLGKYYFKQNIFPLLFFLFAVPFWEFLNPIFLKLTTLAVNYFLDFLPIVAFMDGNRIEVPYGMLEISGGCSGIRYFEISFALAVFVASMEKLSFRLKCLIVLLGITLGIVTNWIRVLGLIWVGYDSKMTSSLMNDHDTYGLILFMLVIAPLLFFINWLSANYEQTNEASKEKTPTVNVDLSTVNKSTLIYLSCFILITFSTVLLIGTGPTNQINDVTNQSESNYSLLNNYGNYQQTVTDYEPAKSCVLIIRQYRFLEVGEDNLPLNQLYNSNDFYATESSVKKSPNSKDSVETNYLMLKNKKTRQKTELYYWYEYAQIKITNKYLAKLFEIVFLINPKNKIALNVIACPAQEH